NMEVVAYIAGALGISEYWANVIVTAIEAGSTVLALISMFASFGLTSALILTAKSLLKKGAKKTAVAY
ncbi:circular bacteriocin, circularin A/uberolysin family, partial [Priestia flexa]